MSDKEIKRAEARPFGFKNLNPETDWVTMPNGHGLFWKTNEAGGRTYYSDEVGGGVIVMDTALQDPSTILFALSMEQELVRVEKRHELDKNLKELFGPRV